MWPRSPLRRFPLTTCWPQKVAPPTTDPRRVMAMAPCSPDPPTSDEPGQSLPHRPPKSALRRSFRSPRQSPRKTVKLVIPPQKTSANPKAKARLERLPPVELPQAHSEAIRLVKTVKKSLEHLPRSNLPLSLRVEALVRNPLSWERERRKSHRLKVVKNALPLLQRKSEVRLE